MLSQHSAVIGASVAFPVGGLSKGAVCCDGCRYAAVGAHVILRFVRIVVWRASIFRWMRMCMLVRFHPNVEIALGNPWNRELAPRRGPRKGDSSTCYRHGVEVAHVCPRRWETGRL